MRIHFGHLALIGALVSASALAAVDSVSASSQDPTPFIGGLPPGMLEAMRTDLGLDERRARELLGRQDRAADVENAVRARLGKDMVGAYLDDSGTLTINITDQRHAGTVHAAGGHPRLVRFSLAELTTVTDRFARLAAPGQVASWYIDQPTNRVMLISMPGRLADARALVAATGVAEDRLSVREGAGTPETVADIRGGDAYRSDVGGCSVGFPVRDATGTAGFITAGHCSFGETGTRVTVEGGATGEVAGARFPGDMDGAWVRTPGHNPTNLVNDHQGGVVRVAGSKETPVGGRICRSGDTSGWHCGRIIAKDVVVDYGALGKVSGLTRTDACADPGDSGGSVLSGDQLQGVTSGVDGRCSRPLPPPDQAMYFQPAIPILRLWRLIPAGQSAPASGPAISPAPSPSPPPTGP